MKRIYFFSILVLVSFNIKGLNLNNCSPDSVRNQGNPNDSVEYDLIIVDPGFENWLITQPPEEFYSNDYYAFRDRLYADEWNRRYNTFMDKELYDNYIDYQPGIDYGIDLNYKLYYYFKYFEKVHHLRLLNFWR